jgi:hypothetical protein
VVDRHRTAASLAAKAVLPFLDTLEKTQATYNKDLAKLNEKLAGPTGNFHEIEIAEARSKLAGMPPQHRFSTIKRAIEKGSDLIVAAMRSDAFLTDGFLTEAEQSVLVDHWRQSRFPEEFQRLRRLETDVAILERDARILQSYQQSIANGAIVANGIPPTGDTWGAPGPAPKNYGAAPTLAERAARMKAALARG